VEKLILNQLYADVDVRHISTHEEGSMLHRVRIFFWAVLKFLHQLIYCHIDVVHLHVAEKGSVVRKSVLVLIARAFRKPVIIHTHGCEFHLFFESLPRFGKAIVAWFFRRSSCVITLSDSWKHYYASNCRLKPERVVVLHNPVELPRELPRRVGSDPVQFAFLGRIGQRKGTFDLIQAFALLPIQLQQRAVLTLAGDGEIAQAQQLAERLGLGDRVRFLGWINPKQRNDLLASSDVFLLPSYNEGLPVAMLEAMAWGLPVVVTPVGGITDIVTHNKNGLLVPPGDVGQLANALQTLIEQEPVRLRLGNHARQRVTPLDISYYCRVLLSIYRSALTQASSALPETLADRTPEELRTGDRQIIQK
jgi:glycosyltransferase involved in cell wall biosynthesis